MSVQPYVKVVASTEAIEFARDSGGRVFVWAGSQRCCGGSMTLLFAATSPPRGRHFERVDATGLELWFDPGGRRPPREIHLEVRGRRQRRIVAYWDGCAYAL